MKQFEKITKAFLLLDKKTWNGKIYRDIICLKGEKIKISKEVACFLKFGEEALSFGKFNSRDELLKEAKNVISGFRTINERKTKNQDYYDWESIKKEILSVIGEEDDIDEFSKALDQAFLEDLMERFLNNNYGLGIDVERCLNVLFKNKKYLEVNKGFLKFV